MDYGKMTVRQLVCGIKSQQFTSSEVTKFFLENCEKYKQHNAVVETFDDALQKAKDIDDRIANGEDVGALAGVPVILKDNILYKGKHTGCASKFMQNFIAPYSSTIVKKLENAGAVIIGRANMDEFAMGGSCEKSVYGPCKNAFDMTKVAGGSSGGSAVSVACEMAPIALGTDTGGSIRQPSSFNGVVGIKPTYGTVSRYGIVAFASSTDQASPITKDIEDNKLVLSVLSGKDANDQTTIDNKFDSVQIKKSYKIGLCKEVMEKVKTLETYPEFMNAIEALKTQGCEIVEVSVPHIMNSLACYYILTPAEATSNLARFDGVKYTTRSEKAEDLEQVYIQSRSEGFGREVQKRIMLGNFVLSSGYFDAYYGKAKKLQMLLRKEFSKVFEECDAIVTPTTPGTAFDIGGKSDPISMYLEDLFTVPASISGIPALSVSNGKAKNGLPLGIQFMGRERSENMLYDLAEKFETQLQGGKN